MYCLLALLLYVLCDAHAIYVPCFRFFLGGGDLPVTDFKRVPLVLFLLCSGILVVWVTADIGERVRPRVHIYTKPPYFMQGWYLSRIVFYDLCLMYFIGCIFGQCIEFLLLYIYLFFCGALALFRVMATTLPGCQDSWALIGEGESPTPIPQLSLLLFRTPLRTCLIWMALPAARLPAAYFNTPTLTLHKSNGALYSRTAKERDKL